MKDGYVWGQPWGTAWFKLRCNVPLSFRGEIVYLIFQTKGEAILYHNGLPVQAVDHGRSEYRLLDRAKGGERIELYVEAGANSAFGKFNRRRMHEPRISVFNQEVWECFWDMRTLADLLDAIEVDTPRRAQILYVLNKAVDQFDYCGEPSRQELRTQAKIARRILKF